MKRSLFLLSVLSVVIVIPVWPQKADRDSLLVQDFENRVKDYVKLQKQVEAALPALKPTPSPEKIAHHEHELAEGIRRARHVPAQGSIFTPEVAAEFRRLIGITMEGQEAVHIRQSLQHAEPVKLRVRAGEPYPSSVPLQSTPPSLLVNLPMLPPEVDYRVVDHDLVLRDAKANLIVDFVPQAIP